MLAAILELPNFAADQEGFGSLSAALAVAWHGTGDSVLSKYLLGRAAAPAPAGESPIWLLGACVFASPLLHPYYTSQSWHFFVEFLNNLQIDFKCSVQTTIPWQNAVFQQDGREFPEQIPAKWGPSA